MSREVMLLVMHRFDIATAGIARKSAACCR